MKVAVLGAGPAGLYFAISMKRRNPAHEITVFERNKPDDTFGWGVVLSAETLDNLAANDPVERRLDPGISPTGTTSPSSTRACAPSRPGTASAASAASGCSCCCSGGPASSASSWLRDGDRRSAAPSWRPRPGGRRRRAELARRARPSPSVFKPDIDVRKCKFVWLGTHQKFDDAFTFIFEETEHGWVWAHAYQFETRPRPSSSNAARRPGALGFGDMTREESIATCERIFARHLGGHALMTNAGTSRGSAWINFPRVLCERWSHKNIVLLGDAAATRAFLDRLGHQARAGERRRAGRLPPFRAGPGRRRSSKYEGARRTEVLRLQSAARNSLEWFEEVERYLDLDPVQFNYSLLTRSQRISHENLRLRDPNGWAAPRHGSSARPAAPATSARADVRAVPAARPEAREPRRRLADGAVQGGRRLPDRLAFRPLRRARQGRRRPGLYRDDLRQPRGPHHAGLHRFLCARARGGLEAAGRFRACRDRGARSAPRSAIPAPRARPSSAGRRWTRRCRTATGR